MEFHHSTSARLTSRYWECQDMECLDGGGTLTGVPDDLDVEAEAIAHTRATGHPTSAVHRHSTEYFAYRDAAPAPLVPARQIDAARAG